jgi:hypothetical protein
MTNTRRGTLVILACHGVFDPDLDRMYAEHPEDQPVYEAHIAYAFRHLVWRVSASPFLVISGGPTKIQRHCSESRSYVQLARSRWIPVPPDIGLEEFALTSIENVLFSLYVYHLTKRVWPEEIEVISWEFKRVRFEQTLDAINRWPHFDMSWPPLRFFPVGDLWGRPKARSVELEKAYIDGLSTGIDAYYALPETKEVLLRRDVYDSRVMARKIYGDYPLPF